jgi:hypothetical protein
VRSCEHGNEPLGFIRVGALGDRQCDCHLLMTAFRRVNLVTKLAYCNFTCDQPGPIYLSPGEWGSRVSSGSIVSDYGLDNRAIGVRSPVGSKDFSSSLCVQTGSGAHPVSCTKGTGGPSPGGKRGRGVMLTTHPHLVPRS